MPKTFEKLLLELYNDLKDVAEEQPPKIKFYLQTILVKNFYPAGYYKPPLYPQEINDFLINSIVKIPKFFILDTRKFSNFRKIKPLVSQSLNPLFDYKGISLIIEVLSARDISFSNSQLMEYVYNKYTFKQEIRKKKEDAFIFAPYSITRDNTTFLIFKNLSFSKNKVLNLYNPFNPFFKKYIIVQPTHHTTKAFIALNIGIINKEIFDKHYNSGAKE